MTKLLLSHPGYESCLCIHWILWINCQHISVCFQANLLSLHNGPQRTRSGMLVILNPKRSCKIVSLVEKVKVHKFILTEREKQRKIGDTQRDTHRNRETQNACYAFLLKCFMCYFISCSCGSMHLIYCCMRRDGLCPARLLTARLA